MPRRSTTTNLCNFSQFVLDALEEKSQVDVIYTDFSKAFDKLSHIILLEKLRAVGFHHDFVCFMESYLINRCMYVSCNNFNSFTFEATSGVPQGSNLGPLIFLIFINDIVSVISYSRILLFADDVKIFLPIRELEDSLLLQSDLDSLVAWAKDNELKFNVVKCKCVTYHRTLKNVNYCYTMYNEALVRVDCIRDLGVFFDSKMTFNVHIETVVKDAFKLLGFIFRNTREFTSTKPFDTLYNSYVRSKLEYSSVVWSPYYTKFELILERVQFKYLKLKYFMKQGVYVNTLSYVELMVMYDCDSLKFRRIRAQQVYLHKLLNSQVDDCYFLFRVPFAVPHLSTRQNVAFYVETPRTNAIIRSPLYSMCMNHNRFMNDLDLFLLPLRSYVNFITDKLHSFKL